MTDLLSRDAMILVTSEAARKAGIAPESFLNRYFGETGRERDDVEQFLFLMELIYTKKETLSVWDARWSLDNRSVQVLAWMED